MDKVLSTTEIIGRTADAIFATEGEWVGSALYGRLDNGRPVAVIASENNGLVSIAVNIPGNGKLGFRYQMFADDATEARIQRYISHHLAGHCQRVAEWETESLLSA